MGGYTDMRDSGNVVPDAESRAFCGHSIFEEETDEDELDIN